MNAAVTRAAGPIERSLDTIDLVYGSVKIIKGEYAAQAYSESRRSPDKYRGRSRFIGKSRKKSPPV